MADFGDMIPLENDVCSLSVDSLFETAGCENDDCGLSVDSLFETTGCVAGDVGNSWLTVVAMECGFGKSATPRSKGGMGSELNEDKN